VAKASSLVVLLFLDFSIAFCKEAIAFSGFASA